MRRTLLLIHRQYTVHTYEVSDFSMHCHVIHVSEQSPDFRWVNEDKKYLWEASYHPMINWYCLFGEDFPTNPGFSTGVFTYKV